MTFTMCTNKLQWFASGKSGDVSLNYRTNELLNVLFNKKINEHHGTKSKMILSLYNKANIKSLKNYKYLV